MKREMHNLEAERALLGGLLQEGGLDELRYLQVTADEFYRPEHKQLFKLIKLMSKGRLPGDDDLVSLVTVADRIGRSKTHEMYGGVAYVLGLPEYCPSVTGMSQYSSILRGHYNSRLIASALDLATRSLLNDGEVDPQDIIAQIRAVSSQLLLDNDDSLDHAAQVSATENSIMEGIDRRAKIEAGELDESAFGLLTGFSEYDKMVGAVSGGHITYMCARPGMGKSASMLAEVDIYLRQGKRVGVVSLEMGVEQLHRRLICMRASIDMGKMQRHDFEGNDIARIFDTTGDLLDIKNLQVCAQSGMTVAQISAQVRKMEATMGGIDVVFIDYYQRIQGLDRRMGRREQLEMISTDLADLSHEMDTPITVLAQLNRDCDKREKTGFRPIVTDIGNSDGPNRDGDLIVLIHRPSVHASDAQLAEMSVSERRAMEWIIVKNRHGMTGTVKLEFTGEFQQIKEIKLEL